MSRASGRRVAAAAVAVLLGPAVSRGQEPTAPQLYASACAACHGDDGRGRSQTDLGFETPLPDFSDCEFASREPDPDWFAIIHQGGPVRAFDRMMPAFGEALDPDEIHAILSHVRAFCTDTTWPRGEFNLPRALFTEKAFPEDEAVVTSTYDTGDEGAYEVELLYEKRFGSRHMIEVAVPFAGLDLPDGDRATGFGDVALAYKYAAHHDLDSGHIVSLGGEVILPTGAESDGLGKGSTILEPFVTWGWLLGDSFVQAHAFAELPTERRLDDEIGVRLAIGRTWTSGGEFGRAWTPMLEVLAARELTSGAVGARIPVNQTAGRGSQIVAYVLWDWFDGGLFDGW